MPEPDWFQVTVRPFEILEGHSIWSVDDITARKAINDVLIRERQDLGDFLDLMPIGVYSVDVDGTWWVLVKVPPEAGPVVVEVVDAPGCRVWARAR